MKQHLSSRQISAWAAGERAREDERHVAECPECRAEVAGLENAVRWFRGSVHAWSDTSVPTANRSRGSLSRWRPQWALIAATLAILAGVPIYRNVERQREAEQARADALLWKQVDAGLSRPVPAPMEPLLSLVPGEIR